MSAKPGDIVRTDAVIMVDAEPKDERDPKQRQRDRHSLCEAKLDELEAELERTLCRPYEVVGASQIAALVSAIHGLREEIAYLRP